MKEYPFDKYKSSKVRVIIDSDCACEGDDAFAIAHALITTKFEIKAICAASFLYKEDSVKRSYDAILRLLDEMDTKGKYPVLMGSLPFKSENEYEISPASQFIIDEALRDDDKPLFVVVQGAITNLAVALKERPEIAKRMQCIWIGGASYPEGGNEFNLSNDVYAARAIMESSVPLWQVPRNVYSKMRVSFMTLYENLHNCGKVGNYLLTQLFEVNKKQQEIYHGENGEFNKDTPYEAYAAYGSGETWVLGDSPVVGLMLNAQVWDRDIIGAPYINDDSSYTLRPDNERKIAVYKTIDSQYILNDFFSKMRYQFED